MRYGTRHFSFPRELTLPGSGRSKAAFVHAPAGSALRGIPPYCSTLNWQRIHSIFATALSRIATLCDTNADEKEVESHFGLNLTENRNIKANDNRLKKMMLVRRLVH